MTTIRVREATRDRLNSRAKARGVSADEELGRVLAIAEQYELFVDGAATIAAMEADPVLGPLIVAHRMGYPGVQ